MKFKKAKYVVILIFYSALSFGATECPGNIERMYIGDREAVWIFLDKGGSAKLLKDNPNQKNIYSAALAAYMAGKSVTIRYSSKNADCSASNSDVVGIFLE